MHRAIVEESCMSFLWFLIFSILPFCSEIHLYQICKLSVRMPCNHVFCQEINTMEGCCLNKMFMCLQCVYTGLKFYLQMSECLLSDLAYMTLYM